MNISAPRRSCEPRARRRLVISVRALRRLPVSTLFLVGSCAVLVQLACSSDSSTSEPPATTPGLATDYSGVWAGPAGETGLIDLKVGGASSASSHLLADTSPRPLSGTLILSSVIGPITLRGTIDPGASVTFSGAASSALGSFTCTGSLVGTSLRGTCTGADGLTREFNSAALGVAPITRYCGTFTGPVSGALNLFTSGATAGAVLWNESLSGAAAGTVSGASVQLSFPLSGAATGTIAGSAISGTWSVPTLGMGTWTADSTGCPRGTSGAGGMGGAGGAGGAAGSGGSEAGAGGATAGGSTGGTTAGGAGGEAGGTTAGGAGGEAGGSTAGGAGGEAGGSTAGGAGGSTGGGAGGSTASLEVLVEIPSHSLRNVGTNGTVVHYVVDAIPNQLWYIRPDGTQKTKVFDDTVYGVAANVKEVFFVGPSGLWTVPALGSTPTLLAPATSWEGVATDGVDAFVTERAAGGAIRRFSPTGEALGAYTGQPGVRAIAADDSRVYWSTIAGFGNPYTGRGVWSAPKDMAGTVTPVIPEADFGGPKVEVTYVSVSGADVFALAFKTIPTVRYHLLHHSADGSGPTTEVVLAPQVRDLAHDATYLYYIDFDDARPAGTKQRLWRVSRSNLTGPKELLLDGLDAIDDSISGLLLDDQNMFITTLRKILRGPKP